MLIFLPPDYKSTYRAKPTETGVSILLRYHIETSPLICRANQWTGFYMITDVNTISLIIWLFDFMELITIWHVFVTEMSIDFSIASFIAFGPINIQGISEVKIFSITKLLEFPKKSSYHCSVCYPLLFLANIYCRIIEQMKKNKFLNLCLLKVARVINLKLVFTD